MTILHPSIWVIIPVLKLCVTSYLLSITFSAVGRERLRFKEGEKQANE